MEMNLKVEHTYANSECDQPGCSGGYSEGADVFLNGKMIYQFVPTATCFGGNHMNNEDLIKGIVEGVLKEVVNVNCVVTVEENYG